MKNIPLTKGMTSIVDDRDFTWISKWKWHICSGYAARNDRKVRPGRVTKIFMHRLINETPDGLETDHMNNDKLDNRRENLRSATASENRRNRGILSTNTNGHPGVYFRKDREKYEARVRIGGGKRIRAGLHATAELASEAYNKARLIHHGEFAQ